MSRVRVLSCDGSAVTVTCCKEEVSMGQLLNSRRDTTCKGTWGTWSGATAGAACSEGWDGSAAGEAVKWGCMNEIGNRL